MEKQLDRTSRQAALKIIAVYGLFAALWIYFSDIALDLLVPDRSILVRISVFKGFFFIIVTSAILYHLIVRYIRKTRAVEKDLHASRNLINSLIEGTTDSIFAKDREGRYLLLNSAAARVIGKSSPELVGQDDTAFFTAGEAGAIMAGDRRVMDAGRVMTYEDCLTSADGAYRTFLSTKGPILDEGGEVIGLFGISRDITERKWAEEIHEATIELLQICNEAGSKRELMRELTRYFHRLTGCEAVGVRLREGNDFPYYEIHGFPEEFLLLENSLCAYDQQGELVRDESGHPAYDCMCGNVLSGRFDPAKPFFTTRGSFWSSCTTELLATTTDEERQAKTRNRCNGEGYESVALVPLRAGGETFGLFQFNDRRKGRFTAEKVALYEELVAYVSIALAKLTAEEALSESSQFSSQIINSAEEGIIVYGRDMRYQVWNPFMERLTGRKAGEVIGKLPMDCFPFLGESGIMENIGRALSGQQLASTEFLFESFQSGLPRWISDTCVPLRNTKGEIIGVIGMVRDITERKQSEKELKDATRRLQLAAASGQLGIWDWDIINNFLVWNDRMFDLYGVSRDNSQMNLNTFEKCLHPDDMAAVKEETRSALNGEKDYDLEFRIILPDGSLRFIKSNAQVIRDDAGVAVRMIGMNQDITEWRHLEEQLRQSQKMEAIGQLAGGIAHDFNNILTAIYGYCNILQMKVGEDAPFRSDIDNIYSAAERAANLTRSLLAFSRKQIMTPRTINLNDIVMNVGKLITRIIGEDIRMKTEFNANPLMINADSGQIEQVLMNLSANARDAMPGGGLLTIETDIREIDEGFTHAHGYGAPGKYAVISVSDTGKGMDDITAKKIFEPFYTTKEVGKGTGLGLSIVYGVVKQHNGFINVYSEPEKGSAFKIYLPLAGTEICAEEDGNPLELSPMGHETVLLVEDDKSIQKLAESVLREFGYRVILADDGVDAIGRFKENSGEVDIIVIDMIMPKKSGKEAYEEISRMRPGVKVIFISGYSPDLLQDRGVLDSGEDVLIKPFRPLDLVRKVRSVLDG